MKRTMWQWLVFTMVIGLLGGCGTSDQPTFQGSRVPWAELLAFAEQEAQKVDRGAVLVLVSASAPRVKREAGILEVRFRFARPDGTQFDVSFDDTNPQATVAIEDIKQAVTPLTAIEAEHVAQAVKQIQITPAQVMEHTWAEGQAFRAGDNLAHAPVLALEFESTSGIESVNPLWMIYYDAAQSGLTFWIDAVTGEIVHRTINHAMD